jgi:hypothetical protein
VRRIGPQAVAAALAIAAARFVTGDSFGQGFPLDDAWIHMVYGLALRSSGILAYDDGHPSTGCTSPAWALLVGVAHALAGGHGPSMRAATIVQWIGLTLHAVQASLAARLAGEWAPRRAWAPVVALAAGALVACAPTLAYAAASGMEVPLEATLLLASLLAASRRRFAIAGVLAGLAAIARPEGVLAIGVVALLAFAAEGVRASLRAAGGGLLLVAARATRDLVVSGRPLPATFYVKANPGAQPLSRSLQRGLVEVLGRMPPASHGVMWAAVALALGLGAVAVARRLRGAPLAHRAASIGSAAALGLVYAAAISVLSFFEKPQSFYYQRYVCPPLPLVVVSGVAAAAWMARALRGAGALRALAAFAILAGAGVADEVAGWRADRARFAADVQSTNDQQVAIGRWIDEHLRKEAVVWTIDAGAVRYWGRRPTVDLVRLNTPELFDGIRVKKAWWPTAIVVIPELFQTMTAESLLDVALVARSSTASVGEREAWRHEVHLCRADAEQARDNRVIVSYDRRLLVAVGRCVAPGR